MKVRKCLKCKKMLVGKNLVLCSSCKRTIGKYSKWLGTVALVVGNLIIKYTPKKKL